MVCRVPVSFYMGKNICRHFVAAAGIAIFSASPWNHQNQAIRELSFHFPFLLNDKLSIPIVAVLISFFHAAAGIFSFTSRKNS
jgi:hypothetical protein